MAAIRPLPSHVVNKIAAGEVIERPASIVKELLENAVDAGAARIDVEVQQGGCELVRVVDDGAGIDADDLPLAVASHATSKLADADDLFRVTTLGFRGEALASIAAVSRFRLRSRPHSRASGAEIEVVGGRPEPVRACGCPPGTAVEVSQLFFNAPVRRKFLRTSQTEMGHVSAACTRIALARPDLQMALKHGGRQVFDLPATSETLERLALFFGGDLASDLIEVESEDAGARLWGYVASPTHSRGDRRMQYLFLNGRPIQDRSLSHALGEAYRGLLMSGRHPIVFLYLELPADAVDVNVHPTKQEVRFRDGHRLYSQLLATLRTKFLSSDLSARLRPVSAAADRHSPQDEVHEAELRRRIAEWTSAELDARQAEAATGTGDPSHGGSSADVPGSAAPFSDGAEPTPVADPWHERDAGGAGPREPHNFPAEEFIRPEATPSAHIRIGGATGQGGPSGASGSTLRALQLHNSYLVAETDDGMVVIDQHALHERVLYEQLRQRVLDGRLECQRLLVPEPVDLSPLEAAAARDNRELLAQLGLELEPFGGDTVLVETYPAMLRHLDPQRALRDLVGLLLDRGRAPDRRDLLDELLHMIACKAAVKAGDPLSPEEIAALLEQRDLAQDSHHCPHGRPTALVFTKDELEKQFKRT